MKLRTMVNMLVTVEHGHFLKLRPFNDDGLSRCSDLVQRTQRKSRHVSVLETIVRVTVGLIG